VAYILRDAQKKRRIVIESTGNNQLDAMHLLATEIQEMVHKLRVRSRSDSLSSEAYELV
jgi:hypothetical protein